MKYVMRQPLRLALLMIAILNSLVRKALVKFDLSCNIGLFGFLIE